LGMLKYHRIAASMRFIRWKRGGKEGGRGGGSVARWTVARMLVFGRSLQVGGREREEGEGGGGSRHDDGGLKRFGGGRTEQTFGKTKQ
jgi:hypothetical protein